MSWHGSNFHITDTLLGETTGDEWILLTKGQLHKSFDGHFEFSLNKPGQ